MMKRQNSSISKDLDWLDFEARMYACPEQTVRRPCGCRRDPTIARLVLSAAEAWYNPDPAEQFMNPYLAMGRTKREESLRGSDLASGQPVGKAEMYVDPDGEFVLPLLFLVFTDIGYEIQKSVSPVALHVDVNFGSNSLGVGFDMSVGMPQIMPISYRYEFGATYFRYRSGGYGTGWQVRTGSEWSFGGGFVQYGGMRYRDYTQRELMADQVVHTAQLGTPLFNISYSNDTEDSFPWARYVPLIPKLREGSTAETDRYRTASGRVRVGPFDVGFWLHTGEADQIRQVDTNGDGNPDTRAFVGGNINDPRRSNGIAYFGFMGLNVGWDSEGIRNYLQNRVAHDGWSSQPLFGTRYPWILPVDRKPRFVFQFGGF